MNPEAAAAVAARMEAAGLKPDMPESRLARAVRAVASAHGVPLSAAVRPPLVDEVIEHLAVHESWFFRDPRQLAALAGHVLPTLSGPLHVWCAGCGNGQEAWTLAMLLAEVKGLGSEWQVTATDLSSRALAVAERGVYRTVQLRGLSRERRERWMRPAGDEEWQVAGELRTRVVFERQNVVAQRPPVNPGSCQVVLCRNVLIYLHDDGVRRALSSFGQAIVSEGWLLVGAAESLWGVTDDFQMVRLPGAFAYRKTGAAGAVGPRQRAASGRVVRPALSKGSIPPTHELLAVAAAAAAAGRYDDAAKAYRQAAYLDPDLIEAHAGLATALAAGGDERGARRAQAVADRLRRA